MKITHIIDLADDETEILEKARQIIGGILRVMDGQLSNDDYNSLITTENVLCNIKTGFGATKTIEGYKE